MLYLPSFILNGTCIGSRSMTLNPPILASPSNIERPSLRPTGSSIWEGSIDPFDILTSAMKNPLLSGESDGTGETTPPRYPSQVPRLKTVLRSSIVSSNSSPLSPLSAMA